MRDKNLGVAVGLGALAGWGIGQIGKTAPAKHNDIVNTIEVFDEAGQACKSKLLYAWGSHSVWGMMSDSALIHFVHINLTDVGAGPEYRVDIVNIWCGPYSPLSYQGKPQPNIPRLKAVSLFVNAETLSLRAMVTN